VIYSVAYDSSNLLGSGSQNKQAQLWDTTTGLTKYNISLMHVIWSVAFSNNGLFAGVDANRNFRLWNTSNGALVRNWTNHTDLI